MRPIGSRSRLASCASSSRKARPALQRYRTEHGADALMTDKLGAEQQNIVVQKLAALQAAETKARTETIERRPSTSNSRPPKPIRNRWTQCRRSRPTPTFKD